MNKNFIVITGANSGNGKQIATKLNSLGYPLLLLDINIDSILQEYKNNNNVLCEVVDVVNFNSFKKAIDKGIKTFGNIGGIINNAGVMILEKADKQPLADMNKMIDINFKGVVFGTQIAFYCGIKYTVRGYSETVRAEVASSNIRVSVISPGVVKTKLLDGTTNKQIKDDYIQWRDDANAFIEAENIADSIAYILEQPPNVTIREIVIGPTTQIE